MCCVIFDITTVFIDTRRWKTKHLRKRFQIFRQSCVLLTDRIKVHQLQPLVWPSNLLYVMLSGCDWWISIRSVNNTQDWWKVWKRFRRCFCFPKSRINKNGVVILNLFEGSKWACKSQMCASFGLIQTCSYNHDMYVYIHPTFEFQCMCNSLAGS